MLLMAMVGRVILTSMVLHLGQNNHAQTTADRPSSPLSPSSSSPSSSSSSSSSSPSSRKRRLTSEEQLISDLFRSYDTDARAVVNSSSTVNVQINYMMLRIQRLDERSQVLTTTAIVLTDWVDERLTWDPALYNNIKDIVVRANRIWTPELAIINGAEEMIQEFEKIRVQISSSGRAHWEPGGVFATTCDIDILYFPFDTQACPIEIGAWAYKSSRMNLTNVQTEVEIGEFKINGEWNIIGTTVEWKEVVLPGYLDNGYSKVVFTIRMSRRYIFYVMNIILPCSLLSVLILVVFCVPPSAGEKISVGISVLLAFTVFLLMLADNVPRTSLVVPILVIYLGSTMALGTASVCLTVLVLNFHHRTSTVGVPRWVRIVFLQHGARLFGLLQGDDPPRRVQGTDPEAKHPPGFGARLSSRNSVHCREHGTPLDKFKDVVCCPEPPMTGTGLTRGTLSKNHGYSNSSHDEHLFLKETMQYHKIDPSRVSQAVKERLAKVKGDRFDAETTGEWQLLARVVDRVFFVLVSLLMFGSASLILFSPWYMSARPIA